MPYKKYNTEEERKAAQKAQKKAWYEANKEKAKANAKAHHEAHKEEDNARRRARHEAHREEENAQSKAYNEKHREEMCARLKKHYSDPFWSEINRIEIRDATRIKRLGLILEGQQVHHHVYHADNNDESWIEDIEIMDRKQHNAWHKFHKEWKPIIV